METSIRTFKVEFFEADCRNCLHVFGVPLLSDFDYGNLIFYGNNGTVFAFVSTFEEPWAEIESVLASKVGDRFKPNHENIARFQRVVASCVDESNGQKLGLIPICPRCGSPSVNYGDSKPLGVQEVPFATFEGFMSKPKPKRQELVVDLWNADERSGDLE